MDTIKDKLILYYLICKEKSVSYYNYFSRMVSDIYDIKIITEGNQEPFSVIYRYYLIKILGKIGFLFTRLQDLVDINAKSVEVVKKYKNGDKRIILDMTQKGDLITIKDIINYMSVHNESYRDDSLGNCIFLKCELCTPSDNICLKEYLLKYRDFDGNYPHTLKNILNFNGIKVPESNTTVKICKFKDNKKIFYEVSYKDIHHNHINYFFELE